MSSNRVTNLIDFVLLPLILLLAIVSLVFGSTAEGSMLKCIDATCRVTAEDGGRGTGVVYSIESGRVYVLTNAHVATSDSMKLEFWWRGNKSDFVYGTTVLRSVGADVAVIAIDAKMFGKRLPPVVRLAPMNYKLRTGQTVTSVGCASGAWATAWKGRVLGVYQTDDDIMFSPPPQNGRSGSAMFDECGTMIVALVHMRANGSGEQPAEVMEQSFGLAVNLQRIYAAIYGKKVDSGYVVADREVINWPPPAEVQFVQRGCPPGGGCAPILPYRRQQGEQWKQQGEKDRGQDKRMDELYRTLPNDEEVEPPAEEVPPPMDVEPEPPADKPNVGAIIAISLVVSAFIGGVIGLIGGWREAHRPKSKRKR